LNVAYADFAMAFCTDIFSKRLPLLLRLAGNLSNLVGGMTVNASTCRLSSTCRFPVNARCKMLELVTIVTADATYGTDFCFVRKIRWIESFVAGNAPQIAMGRYRKRLLFYKKRDGSPLLFHRQRSIAVASEAFGVRLRKSHLGRKKAERQ
jgi:hypothetical protein